MHGKNRSSISTTYKHLQSPSNKNYSSKAKDDSDREWKEKYVFVLKFLFMVFCRGSYSTGKEVIMEEIKPPRVSHKNDGSHVNSRAGPKRKSRYTVDDGGDLIECSGRNCRSCTAALIADCVALCCCPCAVVNFLALAFVKVPWMMGRKCLGLGKKKKLESQRKCMRCEGGDSVVERDNGNVRKGRVNEGMMSEISSSELADDEAVDIDCVSARYEAERVWLELYQVGHLGFGRVSFTGIQPQGKGN